MTTTPRIDFAELDARIDLRELLPAITGSTGRRTGEAVQIRSPFRDDHRPSFSVYADHAYDHATGEHFRPVAFVAAALKLDFQSAAAWLAAQVGLTPAPVTTSPYPIASPQPAVEPATASPSGNWVAVAEAEAERAALYLFSDTPLAQRALYYLRHVRGLSDVTIRAARLGFNPTWHKTGWKRDDGTPAKLAPGITIPWHGPDGRVFALRVRRIIGNLAETLDVTAQGSDKYAMLAGSKPGAGAFVPDMLDLALDTLIVEGEFDALIASDRIGLGLNILSGGSAGAPAKRLAEQVGVGRTAFLALDSDTAGRAATERLIAALHERGCSVRLISLPDGTKDITDFVVGGGDLQQAIDTATSPNTTLSILGWPEELPLALERALLHFRRELGVSAAIFLRALLLAVREGVNPANFTIPQITESPAVIAAGVTAKTLQNALDEMIGLFFLPVAPYMEDKNLKGDSSLSAHDTGRHEKKKGRPARSYALRPFAKMLGDLIERVITPRSIEQFDRTGSGRLTRAVLSALVDELSSEALPTDDEIVRNFAGLPEDELAARRAARQIAHWKAALHDLSAAPVPEDTHWHSAATYTAMVAARLNGRQSSLHQAVTMTGLRETTLRRALARAGIVREARFKVEPLAGDTPNFEFDPKIGGQAVALIIESDDEQREVPLFKSLREAVCASVQRERVAGAQISVKYQMPSTHRRATPQEIQDMKTKRAGVVPPTLPSAGLQPIVRHVEPRPQPFVGLGHDPVYARKVLLNTLTKAGYQVIQDEGGAVIDPDTGEILEENAAIIAMMRRHVATGRVQQGCLIPNAEHDPLSNKFSATS